LYRKRRGVVCTTDQRQRGNIIDALGPVNALGGGAADRLFPVGEINKYIDKDIRSIDIDIYT